MSQNLIDKKGAFEARQILGRSPALGEYMLGYSYIGDPYDEQGIYQVRNYGKGQFTVKMRSYRPTNPRTAAQELNRQKFKNAMAGWSALTSQQKEEYNERAKKKGLFGWCLFIREYYSAN